MGGDPDEVLEGSWLPGGGVPLDVEVNGVGPPHSGPPPFEFCRCCRPCSRPVASGHRRSFPLIQELVGDATPAKMLTVMQLH
jgi:hypothetical protein